MLRKIQGNDNVDKKFQGLVDVYEAAKKVEHPWRKSCNQDLGFGNNISLMFAG